MSDVHYRDSRQNWDISFTEDEDKRWVSVTPWRPYRPSPLTSVHDINDIENPGTSDDAEFRIVAEIMDSEDEDSDAFSVVRLDETVGLPEIKSIPLEYAYPELSQKGLMEYIESFENDGVKGRNTYESDGGSDKKGYDPLYGNREPILIACFVRLCLVSHNVLTVWRVTEAYNDTMYWLLVLGNFFLIFEGQIIVVKRAGIEYSWWCPCFLAYLASTIPAIWLIQLNQYDRFVAAGQLASPFQTTTTNAMPTSLLTDAITTLVSNLTATTPVSNLTLTTLVSNLTVTTLVSNLTATTPVSNLASTSLVSNLTATTLVSNLTATTLVSNLTATTLVSNLTATTLVSNLTTTTLLSNLTATTLIPNVTSVTPTTYINTTVTTISTGSESVIGTLNSDIWVIIVEESLVYLLVFSRWLLPRGRVSRDFLADLLLEFIAIASDIMELLAVFDEDEVRGNLTLTYAIMTVWSASFIQFIPILMQRKRFRKARNPNVRCLTRCCGDSAVEIIVTCMSIFLQDLPFLVVRLYIIIKVKLITYSLIFFLLKNIVTVLLLSYRLIILCYRCPSCRRKPTSKQCDA